MNDAQTTQAPEYKDYRFDSSWEGNGQISDEKSKPLWRYLSPGRFSNSSFYGFFRLPVFVVEDLEGHELLSFRRIKRFPFGVYQIKEGNRLIGAIRQGAFLFTKYHIEFESGLRCTFCLPLFTVWFRGKTETGERILVRLWGHRTWFVRLDPKINNFQLLAAIAFIHRERLRHG